MSGFDYWTWFVIAFCGLFGAFAFWEYAAIKSGHREWTFTFKIRGWLGIEPPKPWKAVASIIFALVLGIFTIWFIPHITLGWWGGCC